MRPKFNLRNLVEHKLRVLVRLDLNPDVAVLEVTGCFTALNCRALAPIITRTAAMVGGQAITVDLTSATHIDPEAVTYLPEMGRPAQGPLINLAVLCPDILPLCRPAVLTCPTPGE